MPPADDPTRRDTLLTLTAAALTACAGDTGTTPATDTSPSETGDTGTDTATCEDRTGAQTEGPFYPGEPPQRIDITEGLAGVPVMLDIRVLAQGTCDPLEGAEVDVWSADGDGDYSGYSTFDTKGEGWLRGQQITDATGVAMFETIVPGSYPGRAVHIHVKVRAEGRPELTTQVYFPDALVREVLALPAYAGGAAHVPNGDDSFYANDTLMDVTGDADSTVRATIDVIV